VKKINNILKKIFIIITSLILMYVTLGKYIIVSAESGEAEVENYNLSQDTVPDGYVGIYTAEDFQQLKNSNGSSKYILMKDIDFENEKFEIIPNYSGLLDGNYHKISNINIESSDQYVGIFGILRGIVQNLIIENIKAKSSYKGGITYVGGLAGWANPQKDIENIHIIGNNIIQDSNNSTNSSIGGMFGRLSGTINNCSTTGQVITEALGDRVVGGLIGVADGTIIENCSSNAVVINNSDEDKMCKLGGLIGDYSGPSMAKSVLIGDCNTNGKVINNSIKLSYSNLVLGGVIGQYLQGNNRYNVNNLYSESVIRSKSSGEIGGLIGFSAGNVDNCYTNVMIEIDSIGIGSLAAVGGLIGVCSDIRGSEPVIQNSYSSGNLIIKKEISTIYLGGLIGQSTVTNPSLNQGKMKTILKNSFSSINIDIIEHGSSSSYIGGIIGNGFSIQISNTYAFGKINTENLSSTASLVGIIGLKSNNYVYISRSYWCTETTGLSTSGINNSTVLGKTVDEMLDKDTFIGFDFNSIWTIDESGKSFPYLVNVKKPIQVLKENINYDGFTGEGTEENPILIENAEQLSKINLLTGKEYLKLTTDIDATNIENFNYTSRIFSGTLNGDNHKISNLTVKPDDNYVGIFGQNYGIVQDLKIENLKIDMEANNNISYIGGIAGYNKGVIKNVQINGSINNSGNATVLYMGQIAGYNIEKLENTATNGTLTNSGEAEHLYFGQVAGCNDNTITRANSEGTIKNTGNVTTAYVGGIIGLNNEWISTSSNKGTIIANSIKNIYEGGIVGKSRGKVVNSYSKGNVNIEGTTAVVGGIIGENFGNVTNTYSIDNIQKIVNNEISGGIVGNNSGELVSSYYYIENVSNEEGKGIRQTLDELKNIITYDNWDFDEIWSIEENVSLPTFKSTYYHYYDDAYWEWHTRFTKDDQSYNGEHIIVDSEAFKFYGYGITSYKDFLYKEYEYASEKKFSFILDETKANYHTLDGAGFILNASRSNNELSGYILLFQETKICLYRLDNVNLEEFETTADRTVESYAGKPIASVDKTSATIHNLVMKASPTNITVNDNGAEILNVNLDYSKHVGEDFGLISSYTEHNCPILSEIWFIRTELEINNYSFPVIKSDMNGKILKGAKFEVKNEEGKIVREGITNSNGVFSLTKLKEGKYTIQEVKAPNGYVLNSEVYKFSVSNEGVITFEDTDDDKVKIFDEEGNAKIIFYNKIVTSVAGATKIKKYKTGTTIPVEGAIIGIYDKEGNAVLDSEGNPIQLTTNAKGEIELPSLEYGEYQYKEIQAPEGYVLNDTMYSFVVNGDGSITFKAGSDGVNGIIYNSKVMSVAGATKIRKYITGTTTPVEGAIIGIYDKEGNAVLDSEGNPIQLTTNAKGEIGIPALEYGEYQYKEVKAPEGYVLNDTMYSFVVNGDGSITFKAGPDGVNGVNGIIYNSKVMSVAGATKIRKYITETTIPVEGAIIGIYDKEGNAILDSEGNPIQLTTNTKGEIELPSLEYGEYQYKEIKAPEGYVLNDTMYSFVVNGDGSITFKDGPDGVNGVDGIIYNDKKKTEVIKGHVIIQKYETGTTTPVAGAKIGLYDTEGKELKDSEGNPIQLITNEKGQIEFRIEPGTYQYKEIKAPEGYVLNDTMYSFVVNGDGSITFKAGPDGVNGVDGIIYNDKKKTEVIRGHVIIQKYETGTTTPVAGAKIGLYDSEGNELKDSEGNSIQLITNEKGQIEFRIEPGTYKYKEIEAPEGYVLNGTMYSFIVNEDGSVTFENGQDGGNGLQGIIYNDKKAIEVPPDKDDNEIKDNNEIIDNQVKNNETIISKPSNNVSANIKEGSFPHTGRYTMFFAIGIITLISCYFGIEYIRKFK